MGSIKSVLKFDDDKISFQTNSVVSVFENIPAGFYDVRIDRHGEFEGLTELEEPKVFPLLPCDNVENINDFFKVYYSEKYTQYIKDNNILNKIGVLLHGDPGIGKSNYINHYIKELKHEKDSVIFNINAYSKLIALRGQLKDIRRVQDNPIVLVLEEFEEFFGYNNAESVMKNLLDGIDSIDNLITLASTNYLKKIPESLSNRKSRFKFVANIKMGKDPQKNKEWIKTTIKSFLKDISDEEIEDCYELCKDKPIDEIKHTLIDRKFKIVDIPDKKTSTIGF